MTLTFGPSKTVGDSYIIECSPIGHIVPTGGYVICRKQPGLQHQNPLRCQEQKLNVLMPSQPPML
jgi:hypothetical protein